MSVSGLPIHSVTVGAEETPTPTPTATPTATEPEPTPTPGPTELHTQTTAPAPDATESPGQPGLGVISAIAGLGSALGYLLYRDGSGVD